MNLQKQLEEELVCEFTSLENVELGTSEHTAAVNDVTKLADRLIEIKKIELEQEERREARANEKERFEKQLKEDRIDRIVKNGLTGLGIVTSVGLTVWGTIKSIKFEETGTITTIMGRGFINKLLPKK